MSALEAALATPGLPWIAAAVLLGGLVRGFAGFGTAMVVMPVAAAFVPPAQALAIVLVIDLIGPLPTLPRALRDAAPGEGLPLALGMIAGLPPGLWLLGALPQEAFRWLLAGLIFAMLGLIAAGWRWRGPRGPRATAGAGAASGVMAAALGLAGPPVVLYYMASGLPAAQVRGTLLVFFIGLDAALLAGLALTGMLAAGPVLLGLVLLGPFLLATLAGARAFRPGQERLYRGLAYGIIAASAAFALPVWG